MELTKTPSFRLDGRRALATGTGRGIGLAAASALADAGAHVALAARTATEIAEAANAIRARRQQADPLTLDVRDVEAVKTTIAAQNCAGPRESQRLAAPIRQSKTKCAKSPSGPTSRPSRSRPTAVFTVFGSGRWVLNHVSIVEDAATRDRPARGTS